VYNQPSLVTAELLVIVCNCTRFDVLKSVVNSAPVVCLCR